VKIAKVLFISLILICLSSCLTFRSLKAKVPKKIDNAIQKFVHDLTRGEADKCLELINRESLSPELERGVIDASNFFKGKTLKNGRVVRFTYNSEENEDYVSYEYEEDNYFYLFHFQISGKDNLISILDFSINASEESVEERYSFSFRDKKPLNYIFLSLVVFNMLLTVTTILVILSSQEKLKKLWTIGCVLAITTVTLNWSTSEVTFDLSSITLLGGEIIRYRLDRPYAVNIGIPVVVIIYWVRYFYKRYREKHQIKEL